MLKKLSFSLYQNYILIIRCRADKLFLTQTSVVLCVCEYLALDNWYMSRRMFYPKLFSHNNIAYHCNDFDSTTRNKEDENMPDFNVIWKLVGNLSKYIAMINLWWQIDVDIFLNMTQKIWVGVGLACVSSLYWNPSKTWNHIN